MAGFVLTRDGANGVVVTAPPSSGATGTALVDVVVPDTLSEVAAVGKRGFDVKCAACHGENAGGIDGAGPPLIHRIYEPGHHGDAAFWLATQNGVREHHWNFGNMPPVAGLTKADVDAIVVYVRALQEANGIL